MSVSKRRYLIYIGNIGKLTTPIFEVASLRYIPGETSLRVELMYREKGLEKTTFSFQWLQKSLPEAWEELDKWATEDSAPAAMREEDMAGAGFKDPNKRTSAPTPKIANGKKLRVHKKGYESLRKTLI